VARQLDGIEEYLEGSVASKDENLTRTIGSGFARSQGKILGVQGDLELRIPSRVGCEPPQRWQGFSGAPTSGGGIRQHEDRVGIVLERRRHVFCNADRSRRCLSIGAM
jgi:hypothetical protein